MEFTGERHIPGEGDWQIHLEHIARYSACLPIARGKRVLDAACGSGYGSALLGRCAASVRGVDVDADAVAYASARNAGENVSFSVASVSELPFEADSFDLLVSFETFEHVDERSQHAFLDGAKRIVGSSGIAVISTPDRAITESRGMENEFHIHEVYESEFIELLRQRFESVELYYQNTWLYSEIASARGDRALTVSPEGMKPPTSGQNMIAVCSDTAPLPSLGMLVRSPVSHDEDVAFYDGIAEGIRHNYEQSTSWRITRPLRALKGSK